MKNLLPRTEFLLQALVKRRDDCPHCHDTDTSVVARKHLFVRVRHCDACDLYFTDPTYEESVFGQLYDGLYGAEGSTTDLPAPARLRQLMDTSFRGTDKDCHARLRALRALSHGDAFLELGSSWGYLLQQANEEGFRARGVEISGPRRRFGIDRLGQDILASLDEAPEEHFDVVYSAHTLEHFTDLQGVLPQLARRLRPGTGLLALEVPNFDPVQLGSSVLPTIGAVHPLGFPSGFFPSNLPAAGFTDVQLFESWRDVPLRPVESSSSDVVIALARRRSER